MAGARAALTGGPGAGDRAARALETWHGSGRAILTDSGTTALTVAMRWSMAARGNERIALPAWCCYDLLTALNGARATPVFYDLDPRTLGPDWTSLQDALGARPAAVVVAHLYGMPVDMPRVLELAEAAGVTVIEDAAQGSGATLHGRPLGSFGDLAVLSFGRGKGVTAGKGGALLVNAGWRGGGDESMLLPGARGSVELVALKAQWMLARPSLYRIPASLPFLSLGETVYREPAELRRMSAVASSVLEITWGERQAEVDQRQKRGPKLLESLRGASMLSVVEPIGGAKPGWLRLPVLVHAGPRMPRALGVIQGYPVPLPELPAAGAPVQQRRYPGARLLAESLRTVPVHRFVTDAVLSRITEWARAASSA